MQKLDALVVGAIETAKAPLSIDEMRAFLPADHVFFQLWPQVSDITILHPLQALNIIERLDEVLDQPGDIIECGIYQGATSVLMAKLLELRHSKKKLFLFDSFQGLPEPNRQVDAGMNFQKGGWAASRQDVESLLEKFDVAHYCKIFEGWFSETLPTLMPEQEFCFGYFDADLYSSTMDCLREIWPRLKKGSVAVFDDYHHPSGGVRKAVDDWIAGSDEILQVGPASQSFIVRGLNQDNCSLECFFLQTASSQEILITFDALSNNKLLRALVERKVKQYQAYGEQLSRFASLINGNSP